jgi:CHAT domain-containing protein
VAARDLGVGADARALFELLVAPAGDLGAGTRRLVIAPDGALWELPFQALQGADGRYLVERSAIAYAPSLTALATPRPVPPAARANELLAIGNPLLRDGGPPPLAEAERQVGAIARRFPAGSRDVRVGAMATEAAVKSAAGRSRIVHIAAHGMLDAGSPMYSALLLAPSADEDGRLEARELVELDLGGSLVVLSACETARGRVSAGEGLIGLSWAALVAGARRVVVSQWKVDAASTTDLMTAFYRHLGGGADEARALQRAALEVSRKPAYRHPFYWAAFTVVGG